MDAYSQPLSDSLENAYVAVPHQYMRLKNVFFRIFFLSRSDLLNSLVIVLRAMWQIFISDIISGVVLPFPVHTGVQGRVVQARQTIIFLPPWV